MTAKKNPEDLKTAGRKSSYTKEIAAKICDLIAEGESLRDICKMTDMPARQTVYEWLIDFPEFAYQYARAREEQADLYADEIVQIADTVEIGEKVTVSDDGTTVTREDMTQHRRLKIDARKWKASKLAPKKYGERLMAEHSGFIASEAPKTGAEAMVSLNIKRRAALERLNSGRPADE